MYDLLFWHTCSRHMYHNITSSSWSTSASPSCCSLHTHSALSFAAFDRHWFTDDDGMSPASEILITMTMTMTRQTMMPWSQSICSQPSQQPILDWLWLWLRLWLSRCAWGWDANSIDFLCTRRSRGAVLRCIPTKTAVCLAVPCSELLDWVAEAESQLSSRTISKSSFSESQQRRT